MKHMLRICFIGIVIGATAIPCAMAGAKVRIGVFGLFHPTELVFAPAPGYSLVVEGAGSSLNLEDGQSARCRVANGFAECHAGERVERARVIRVMALGQSDPKFTLSVPGKIIRNYAGNLEILAQVMELVPVVEMNLEVAVASAVAAESPPDAPLESLKAQAIVTRSYYLAARRRHRSFDFCDTTHCQFLREPPGANSPAAIATRLTRGMVLLYRGDVIPALFSSSCGGRTRMLCETGLSSSGGYPYHSVQCEPCLHEAHEWKIRLDRRSAAPLVAEEGSELARLLLDRKLGWEEIPGNNYFLKFEGDAVVLTGRGAGHGIGLCQFGATAYARQGWSFTQILSHYFPDTNIATAPSR
jgi:Stage II sporulation protein